MIDRDKARDYLSALHTREDLDRNIFKDCDEYTESALRRYMERVKRRTQKRDELEEQMELALEIIEQLVKAPELNDTSAIMDIEAVARDFLRENGRNI